MQNYSSLDDFINQWNNQEKKMQIIAELENQGINFTELQSDVGEINKNLDPFDLILHIAFGKNHLTYNYESQLNLCHDNVLRLFK